MTRGVAINFSSSTPGSTSRPQLQPQLRTGQHKALRWTSRQYLTLQTLTVRAGELVACMAAPVVAVQDFWIDVDCATSMLWKQHRNYPEGKER